MSNLPEWFFEDAIVNEEKETLSNEEKRIAYELIEIAGPQEEDSHKQIFYQICELLISVKLGSTFLEKDALSFLELAPHIFGKENTETPIVVEEDGICTRKNFNLESKLAAMIHERTATITEPSDTTEDAIQDVLKSPSPLNSGQPLHLSEPQWDAIRCVLKHNFTIISGGPGTGKTSIIVTLLRVLVRLGIPPNAIVLCAPTGKAASRMNESIQSQLGKTNNEIDKKLTEELLDAQTLHRLLAYSVKNRRFMRNKERQIRTQLVIVDEASMIDLHLMRSLFDAIPVDARIILVGDAQQLPSVDVGAVLRDLVKSPTIQDHIAYLKENYRIKSAGGDILRAAADVDAGNATAFFEKCSHVEKIPDAGIHLLSTEKKNANTILEAFLENWFRRQYIYPEIKALISRKFIFEDGRFSLEESQHLEALFEYLKRARILCATRIRKTGANAINARLHRRMLVSKKAPGAPLWIAGEPVIMLKNDYERELFNGDQGVVLDIRRDAKESAQTMFVFATSKGFRAFTLGAFSTQVELAYAMTIHKSQGSEFDEVAFVLPETQEMQLSRELIYTAITRARKSVILVGKKEIIRDGIERKDLRITRLSERLARLEH